MNQSQEIALLRTILKEWLQTFYEIRATVEGPDAIWEEQVQMMRRGFILGKCESQIFSANEHARVNGVNLLTNSTLTELEAFRYRNLRKLLGYAENGTSQNVNLFQDDATMEFFVQINGKIISHSINFGEAIDIAVAKATGDE